MLSKWFMSYGLNGIILSEISSCVHGGKQKTTLNKNRISEKHMSTDIACTAVDIAPAPSLDRCTTRKCIFQVAKLFRLQTNVRIQVMITTDVSLQFPSKVQTLWFNRNYFIAHRLPKIIPATWATSERGEKKLLSRMICFFFSLVLYEIGFKHAITTINQSKFSTIVVSELAMRRQCIRRTGLEFELPFHWI